MAKLRTSPFKLQTSLTPKLRFPEFREAGECNRLGDIVEFSSGGTPSKDEPKYWNGHIPWISASSMYETKLAKSELSVTELAIGNGTRLAKKGTILVLVRGSMLFNRVSMTWPRSIAVGCRRPSALVDQQVPCCSDCPAIQKAPSTLDP